MATALRLLRCWGLRPSRGATPAQARCAISTRGCRSPARGCPRSASWATWTGSSSWTTAARRGERSPARPGRGGSWTRSTGSGRRRSCGARSPGSERAWSPCAAATTRARDFTLSNGCTAVSSGVTAPKGGFFSMRTMGETSSAWIRTGRPGWRQMTGLRSPNGNGMVTRASLRDTEPTWRGPASSGCGSTWSTGRRRCRGEGRRKTATKRLPEATRDPTPISRR
ncbi:unnamed protein product, partial [Lepidochelys kempii]